MTDIVLWIFILMLLVLVGQSVFYAISMDKALKRYSEELARQGRMSVDQMARVALAKDVHDLKSPDDKVSSLINDLPTPSEVVLSDNLSEEEFNKVINQQLNPVIEEEIDG